eukprot:6826617-Prymnesium_polylepis.1
MLRSKESTEYNGWESHVAACLASHDTAFLPRDALSLRAVTESELADEQERATQVAKTSSTVAEISTSLAALQERQEETSSTVADMSASLLGMQNTLDVLTNALVHEGSPTGSVQASPQLRVPTPDLKRERTGSNLSRI